jgi:hypothetical protein
MVEASAPESNLCGCKIQPALPKIPRLFQNGNHRNVRLRSVCGLDAGIHRRLMRRFPPTARTRLGSCPVIARMIHRMLRGNCAAAACLAALFFNKGMVSNQNDRLSNSRKPTQIPFD